MTILGLGFEHFPLTSSEGDLSTDVGVRLDAGEDMTVVLRFFTSIL